MRYISSISHGDNYSLPTNETFAAFLQDGGARLVHAAVLEYGKGCNLPFEEVYQESMITAAHAIALYDERRVNTKLSTYIYSAVENTIAMFKRGFVCKIQDEEIRQRKRGLRNSVSIQDLPDIYDSGMDEEQMIEQVFLDQRRQLLWDAINNPNTGLTDRERAVLVMTLKGHAQAEIGAAIGISQGEVSKSFTNAKAKIKAALAGRMEG